ncbi:MAG: hypothetical protein U9R57_02820 [Thermodesulfobacteriota bacterium]|nr:hypothetical protein [Thermodesulfobacteriota bacterium]
MNTHYIKVQAAGFVTYSDALIAKVVGEELLACFLSLIGTPSNVKALSAILYGGDTCRISSPDDPVHEFEFLGSVQTSRELGFPSGLRTCRTRKIGETVNKVLVSTDYFLEGSPLQDKSEQSAFVYGPDMPTILDRAFLLLDAATTIPLKSEWQAWLWDEIMQPEKLHSFGGKQLQEAYLVSWPKDDILQGQILEGISKQYLH